MNPSVSSPAFMYNSVRGFFTRCSVVRTRRTICLKKSFFSSQCSSKKSKRESYSYLLDDEVAREIAKHVHEHTSSDGYVFEANPGPCVLTKALLESGIPHLRAFEKEENSKPALKDLVSSYPGRLEIIPEDIMLLPKLETKDRYSHVNGTAIFFQGIKKRSWQEAPPVSLVAVVAERRSEKFMRCMLAKLSVMSSLFAFGRCQFFLIMSEKEHMCITAKPKKNFDKYRFSTVLFNVFFDINFISKISGSCLSSNHLSSKQKVMWEASDLYFTHLVPKADMFESVAPVDKLPELYYFVRHHMAKRTNLVIPEMELWIPNCGPRLIWDGMKYYTRFGDLNTSEMLHVFQLFSSWPEYEKSNFKHNAEEFFSDFMESVTRTDNDVLVEKY